MGRGWARIATLPFDKLFSHSKGIISIINHAPQILILASLRVALAQMEIGNNYPSPSSIHSVVFLFKSTVTGLITPISSSERSDDQPCFSEI